MRRAEQPARPVRKATSPVAAMTLRAGRVGTAVVVTVGLGLTAITERALLAGGANGAAGPPGAAQRGTGAATSRPGDVDPIAKRPTVPTVTTLAATVRKLTLSQRGAAARKAYGSLAATPTPLVGATRLTKDKTWALGTSAIPVPAGKSAMPQVFLFVAHWTAGKWKISLTGGSQFASQLRRAPVSLVPAAERRLLIRYDSTVRSPAASATPTPSPSDSASPDPTSSPSPTTAAPGGFSLPWKEGDIWTLGSRGPAGTVSFQAPSGVAPRALAVADGRIYHFCSAKAGHGMVLVVHNSGIASEYYDLSGVTGVKDGSVVKQGDFLGKAGNDRPCGGKSGPAQVLFGLRGGAADVSVNGTTLGGWTFQNQQAERGLVTIPAGGPIVNFGPDPTTEASPSVRLNAPGLLSGSESPSPTGN